MISWRRGLCLFCGRDGIRVPEDFALIGYDGDAFAYLTDPPLSRSRLQVSEVQPGIETAV
ncbi:MAG: substrate-binding domain-containing protein [Victivallales bacterium]